MLPEETKQWQRSLQAQSVPRKLDKGRSYGKMLLKSRLTERKDGRREPCAQERCQRVWEQSDMGRTLPPETTSMFTVHVVAKGCVDVCGVCYHQGPCGCPWSVLL